MASIATPTREVKSMQQDTGLQRRDAIVGEIVNAEAYNEHVASWQREGFAVLTPAIALSTIPRDHRIVVSRVQLNPDPAAGDVYQNPLFCGANEVALSKAGLEKIAQCAGVSIDDCERVDSRTVPFVWSYRVRGHWIAFDGQRIDRVATKTLDLRDGAADIKGFKPNQIDQARRHGEAVCESKAINRLYRQYGLKQKYTKAEIAAKPFIVLKLQWEPDMSNPVVAAMVTQLRSGATRLLYPQGMPGAVDPAGLPAHQVPPELRPASAPIEDPEDDVTPRQVSSSAAMTPSAPATSSSPSSGAEALPTEPRYVITSVQRHGKDGAARYFVRTDRTLDSLIEIGEELVAAAKAARDGAYAVELELERTPDGPRIVEIRSVKPTATSELPADARFVVDVKERSGKTNDRPWTRYTVTFKDGAEGTTFSESIAKLAYEAKDKQLPVRATLSTNEKYPDQQNLEALDIIDTRQGTLPLTTEL